MKQNPNWWTAKWWKRRFKNGIPLGVILGAGFGVVVLFFAFFSIAKYNQFVNYETGIQAENRKMENALGAGYKKIKSQGLVLSKYKDLFLKALDVSMTGRYGKTGSQAGMQWIKETHPNISPAVFSTLSIAIEATFNRFQAIQTAKIDKIRAYEKSMYSFPGNLVAGMFGFPKRVNLEKEKQVVSSRAAKKSMESKQLADPKF